jgi:hypothetical protein
LLAKNATPAALAIIASAAVATQSAFSGFDHTRVT